ncbi:MAG: nucleotidyl transferase AbiEii/AbiGii toxin family protein, partial [Nitrospirae bacterium]|nr:nucleotidyl transferase AbiEii/AbiGii toxin family protein [Nitrospirota bacterium]
MTNQANEHSPNLIASVQQRLRNIAQQRRTDYRLILERYAGERFLYRVSQSPFRDQLILKGATLLYLWTEQEFRATRDVDFLGFGSPDLEAIRQMMTEICRVEYAEDGLRFQGDTIGVEDILDEQEYGGVRAKLKAYLGTTRIHLQVDIGFGDVVTPNPIEQEYPTLLGHPAPKLKTYPRETFIAEKFEAMVRLGPMNSRMKDFWDVAALALQFSFDGPTLQSAIKRTFERRDTPLIQEVPDALRTTFYQNQDKSNQWQAFLTRTQPQLAVPPTFSAVGELVRSFLNPIRESILDDRPFTQEWLAGVSWRSVGAPRERSKGNPQTDVIEKEVEATLKTPPKRFKPYPEYKDSGMEWLGNIPVNFETLRLKFAAELTLGQSPPSETYNDQGEGLPFLQGNAEFGEMHPSPRIFCPNPPKIAKRGSHLISVRAPVGAINLADQDYGIGRGLCAVKSLPNKLGQQFSRYLIESSIWQLTSIATGSTYEAVTAKDVGDLICLIPNEHDQHAIAAFLDCEIGKIDTLIQKKVRLIELLKQKRTALITHAVTKGLNPNVPMKDSGTEWLGEIPAHWEVKRLKRISPKQNVGLVINPSTYVD